MGALVGYIVMFLGASIVNLLGGVPLIPLQTLYVCFTAQLCEAVGLGYGKPSSELMQRKPRPSDQPILDRPTLIWLGLVGLVVGITTLGVIAWANDHHGSAVARTMGMTTFAIANVYYALTVKHERRSVFSLDTFDDHRFRIATGLALSAILLGAQLGLLNKILKTVGLNLHEWLICIVAAATIIVASEIRKLILRRREQQEQAAHASAAVEAGA